MFLGAGVYFLPLVVGALGGRPAPCVAGAVARRRRRSPGVSSTGVLMSVASASSTSITSVIVIAPSAMDRRDSLGSQPKTGRRNGRRAKFLRQARASDASMLRLGLLLRRSNPRGRCERSNWQLSSLV